MDDYRVQLDVFSGPLDLLLFLIRRDELDVHDIAVARVAEQYMQHVRVLEHLDPNAAGEFLVLASTLVEMKSRALLPTPPVEVADDTPAEARGSLVRQLLEYKRFKDAALALGSSADDRARRFVRVPAELPRELQGVDLEQASVWDLLSAFGRVMTAIGRGPGVHDVKYDDTPIEVVAEEIAQALLSGPRRFSALFRADAARSEIIGRFLALLELIRTQRVRAEQARTFDEIYLFLMVEADEGGSAPSAALGTAGHANGSAHAPYNGEIPKPPPVIVPAFPDTDDLPEPPHDPAQ